MAHVIMQSAFPYTPKKCYNVVVFCHTTHFIMMRWMMTSTTSTGSDRSPDPGAYPLQRWHKQLPRVTFDFWERDFFVGIWVRD